MKYMVLDLETQTHVSHKRKANPFHPDNYIVMRGWKVQGDTHASMQHFKSKADVTPIHIPDDVDVIVAHNAKFELLYEFTFSRDVMQAFFARGGRIFCTQYAYYLINGQIEKAQMASLDGIIEQYGGRKKIDGVKALWDAGVLTSDIDPELLEDYLIGTEEEGRNSGDIGNTELVYLGQLQEIQDLGMDEAVRLRMDGLCATSEMEFNGIKVDIDRARADLKDLNAQFDAAKLDLEQYVTDMPEGLVFNWGSGIHLSCLIFGGTVRYEKQAPYLDPDTGDWARKRETAKWPLFGGDPVDPVECREVEGGYDRWDCERQCYVDQDTYLSGKKKGEGKFRNVSVPGEIKVKYQNFFHTFSGYTKPDDSWKTKLTDGKDGPVYTTDADTIEMLAKRDIPFLQTMGRYQALNKEIGTYYIRYDEKKRQHVGMLTCVVPETKIVHHKLNHTSTKTTRLSSSDPNLQNVPRGDKSSVKAMFVSRFPNGVMGEIDYSQLEVVVQGLLSLDANLCDDLRKMIDFHCKRVATKFSCSYEDALVWCKDEDNSPDYPLWKGRRTGVKEFSFQRAYGAGASAIALATGMPEQDVKDLIAAEEKMYPGVIKFNEAVEKEVNATADPFRDPERGWRVFRRGTWQAPTGTIYSWRTWDAPAFLRQRGITDTFSPPELKNYPVQGTGGEIVQIVLGYLWRWFVRTNNFDGKAVLINTVHDCVWVDMHPDAVDTVIPGMVKIMQAVPTMLKKHFDIDCPVPFPVEAETGPNMLDLKHYHLAA